MQLTCSAVGNPSPSYTWTHSSRELSQDTSSVLTIKSATSSDGGQYTCTAKNIIGTVTKTFTVKVHGKCTHVQCLLFPDSKHNVIPALLFHSSALYPLYLYWSNEIYSFFLLPSPPPPSLCSQQHHIHRNRGNITRCCTYCCMWAYIPQTLQKKQNGKVQFDEYFTAQCRVTCSYTNGWTLQSSIHWTSESGYFRSGRTFTLLCCSPVLGVNIMDALEKMGLI